MRLTVIGEPTLEMVLRALNLLAMRDRVPARIAIVRRDDAYVLTVDDPTIADEQAELVVEKLRALVMVDAVEIAAARHGGIPAFSIPPRASRANR